MLGFVSTWSSLVDTKDFCIALVENNNKISYTYRRFYGQMSDQITSLDVLIDGYYWRLEFIDRPNEEKKLNFTDPNRKGNKSSFFSGQHFMATCIRTMEEDWTSGRAALFSVIITYKISEFKTKF